MTKKTLEYEKIWLDMQKAFSAPRMAPYAHPTDDDEIDALARYYWNLALCEALYPALHCLEVVLRNAVHDALSTVKAQADWYNISGLLMTGRYGEMGKVTKAKDDLTRQGKPHDPGRIVAELTFGFWTSLFNRGYDQLIAIPVIPIAFAHAPAASRTRRVIHPILEDIRFLRNRVFHHEPVWYWGNLTDKHKQIIDTVAWLSPPSRSLICTIDRFDDVYRQGWAHHRDDIKYKLLEDEETRKAAASRAT